MSRFARVAAIVLALVPLLPTPSPGETPRDVLVVGMEAEPPGFSSTTRSR